MNNIVIYGAGGFGREVQWLIERITEAAPDTEDQWNILGYIDDGVEVGTDINGHPVLGGADYLLDCKEELSVAIAIGSSRIRKIVAQKIGANSNLSFPNLIDPSVIMSDMISWGKGNIVCAGNILTVNIEIKDFNIINLDCTVGHDCVFESYVTLYPSVNVSGICTLGECVEMGTGAQIIQDRTVGSDTIIGAGSVVIRNIPEKSTAVGNPCKVIKTHE